MNPARQRDRLRTAHGDVVHGAVDREITDAATREEQRSHDVGVGGEREPVSGVDVEHRGVVQFRLG